MPGAVKVLRSLPFLGAPFVSFQYGMGTKLGKTLMYNPGILNEINYALSEFQGRKSALESKSIDSKYYQYLNREGIVRFPFFNDYPVFLNLANMISYYTMNMMQPSERTYKDTLPSAISNIFDKIPFMKQPEMQILYDYVIQPLMIRDTNPVGMFDQPLWPKDATALEKTGYAARAIAEIPLPGIAGIAGLLAGVAAPEATEYLPSFRARQFANAVQGKSSMGIPSSEDPAQRVGRVLSSWLGVPWYRMNIHFSNKK
jgi:hypothetical protein